MTRLPASSLRLSCTATRSTRSTTFLWVRDTNILSYDDAQSISSYAIPAIQWACGAGVVTGKSGSKLDPKGNATRAEVAAMLMRFCGNVK